MKQTLGTSRCKTHRYCCPTLQVLAWTLVDDHQKSVDSLEQALNTVVPQRLADTQARVEELQTRYNALKQSAEEKVRWVGVLAWDGGLHACRS